MTDPPLYPTLPFTPCPVPLPWCPTLTPRLVPHPFTPRLTGPCLYLGSPRPTPTPRLRLALTLPALPLPLVPLPPIYGHPFPLPPFPFGLALCSFCPVLRTSFCLRPFPFLRAGPYPLVPFCSTVLRSTGPGVRGLRSTFYPVGFLLSLGWWAFPLSRGGCGIVGVAASWGWVGSRWRAGFTLQSETEK